jgi:hypothetical protein
MKMKKDIEQRVQEAMDSLEGIQRAEPQPYFYTRLTARLQRDEKTIWETMGSFMARPAVAVAGLCLILVLNVALLLRQDNAGSGQTAPGIADQITPGIGEQGISDNESILASSSSFDYENLDQQ